MIYVVHGAPNGLSMASIWDAAIQMASYDPNSWVFQNGIWNPYAWPDLLGLRDPDRAPLILELYRKYAFQISRIGGNDPANAITKSQVALLDKALAKLGRENDIEFHVDWASWIAVDDDLKHLPFPRYVHNRNGEAEHEVSYCGSKADSGIFPDSIWPDCRVDRYDIDGPIDRLIAKNVDEILVVDTTVGGVRFSKTFEVIEMLKKALDDRSITTDRPIELSWVNDPTGLLEESYPVEPRGWTRSLGLPEVDNDVSLSGRGNPISDDRKYAELLTMGIEAAFSQGVPAEKTGVLLFNHGIHSHNETFDPKINDTLVLNENIRGTLLRRHPGMRHQNVVGGWMGVNEIRDSILEPTRNMRGGNLGHAYLYQTEKVMPKGEWGLLFWDALDRLRVNGVEHIVVAFPQIIVSSIPSIVEFPNQVAREIGYKTFLPYDEISAPRWPGFGNPFADYWPVAAPRLCSSNPTEEPALLDRECCYRLGGCGSLGAYPEQRHTPIDQPQQRLDPALVFDIPAFGHLGYDDRLGAPNARVPVQGQYRGTWSLYEPLNDNPLLADYLAKKIFRHVQDSQSVIKSEAVPN